MYFFFSLLCVNKEKKKYQEKEKSTLSFRICTDLFARFFKTSFKKIFVQNPTILCQFQQLRCTCALLARQAIGLFKNNETNAKTKFIGASKYARRILIFAILKQNFQLATYLSGSFLRLRYRQRRHPTTSLHLPALGAPSQRLD